MIQTELIMIDERQLRKTWSDAGFMIERDGVEYSEAIDVEGAPYTYTETATPIPIPEMATEERLQDAETALGIMFGEAE